MSEQSTETNSYVNYGKLAYLKVEELVRRILTLEAEIKSLKERV